jgi:tetratricopeptide (TPR) repeat protein
MLGLVPEFGRLFVWPARLYADYSPRDVVVHTTWHLDLLPGALLVTCVTLLFIISWRRAPVVAFGLAWLAIAVAPVSNVLIPTGILLAERTLLVPSVGVVLAVGFATSWVLRALRPMPRLVRLTAAGAFVILLTLGFSESAERQYVWKSTDAVFIALANDAPLNFKAHYTYGGRLFEQKRSMDGEREWRKAIALMPEYHGVYVDLAHKYREAHICQAAIPNYQKALSIEPALPLARVGLVACYLELGQWHRARSESRWAIADGYYRRAFEYMIERADSALVASDSLDGTIKWTGKSRIVKP